MSHNEEIAKEKRKPKGEVKFNIFIWSITKGDIQMMAQVNDSKHKLVNQFWVMRVG